MLGIIQVGGQAAADRFTYLPSISLFLLAGIGIALMWEKAALFSYKEVLRRMLIVCTCVAMLLLSYLTIQQIKIWHNSEIFWSYVIRAFPFPRSDPLAHYNLGNALAKRGKLDNAISEYKRALILKPHYPEAHNNLGSVYTIKGKLDEAIAEIEQALAINPNYAMAHNNRGNVYLKKGELDKAISEYKQAIAIKPDHAKAYGNMGLVYYNKGMFDEAIFEYKKALVINPNLAEVHYNLSVAYYYKGNYESAIVHCDRSVGLGYRVYPKLLELLKPYR